MLASPPLFIKQWAAHPAGGRRDRQLFSRAFSKVMNIPGPRSQPRSHCLKLGAEAAAAPRGSRSRPGGALKVPGSSRGKGEQQRDLPSTPVTFYNRDNIILLLI